MICIFLKRGEIVRSQSLFHGDKGLGGGTDAMYIVSGGLEPDRPATALSLGGCVRLSESIDPVGDAISQWARNTIRMQASRVCCTRVCSKHFEAPTYPRRYTGDYNSRRSPGAPTLF
mgnify:CR=1 FL=1